MTDEGTLQGGDDLDDLLDKFEAQCPIPSLEDLAAWQAHHLEHARVLLARAAESAKCLLELIDEITEDLAVERAAAREPPARPYDPRRDLN